MTKRKLSKLVHEGQYVAEVDVELIYTDEEKSIEPPSVSDKSVVLGVTGQPPLPSAPSPGR